MLTLRVHAGPHPRRSCPIAVRLDLDPDQAVSLFQEPGHKPRGCQWDVTATVPRLWFVLSRLEANEARDFQVVPVLQRRKPLNRLQVEALGQHRLRVNLDGVPVVEQDAGPAHPWPGLFPIYGLSTAPAVKGLWIVARASDPKHHASRTVHVAQPVEGPSFARLARQAHWLGPRRQPIMEEFTATTIYASPPGVRLLDVTVALRAAFGPVTFGPANDGGLLTVDLGEDLLTDSSHEVANSVGAMRLDEAQGRRAAWWCAPHRGLAVFDHPDNPGGPPRWQLDRGGVLTADPFAGLADLPGHEPGPRFTLSAGAVLTFRYRLWLHGGEARPGLVRQHYANFAFPPRVEVVEVN